MKRVLNKLLPFKPFPKGTLVWDYSRKGKKNMEHALLHRPRWVVVGYEKCERQSHCWNNCGSEGLKMKLTEMQNINDESQFEMLDDDSYPLDPIWIVSYQREHMTRQCPAYRRGSKRYFNFCKVGEVLSWEKCSQ